MNDSFGVIFFMLALVVGGVCLGWLVTYGEAQKDFIRDCSITSAHIIDEDTVIVCKVLKVRQTETPVDKKPEISL